MGKNKDEILIKYTLMPFNEEDDYEHFFSLSLRDFAKNTKDKTLLAPLIIYNSELDVPMDNDLEEYTVYCNESQILDVIRKQEVNDVFRTLVLHGFDISIDDLKEIYITIARRNQSDLCINVIQDTGIDSNITLYIDSSIEQSEGKVWDLQKQEMYSEIESFIKNYDSYDYYDYSEEDIASVESFLEALLGKVDAPEKKKDKKEEKPAAKNNVTTLSLVSPTDFEDVEHEEKDIEEDVIAFSFECNDDIVKIACVDEELYVIEENDYEIALNQAQMEFIVECYAKILKMQKDKPRS
jgi:hypothetical protein